MNGILLKQSSNNQELNPSISFKAITNIINLEKYYFLSIY